MKKVYLYYIFGYILAVSIGFFTSENPFYGFIVATFIYIFCVGIFSVFFGIFNADPMDKSPYERRKGES